MARLITRRHKNWHYILFNSWDCMPFNTQAEIAEYLRIPINSVQKAYKNGTRIKGYFIDIRGKI